MSKYDEMALDDLGDELVKRELPMTGAKEDLIQRLIDDNWRHKVTSADTTEEQDSDVNMDIQSPSSVADLDSDPESPSNSSVQGDEPAAIIKCKLDSCLASVKYVGSFMASQASQLNVDPGICVNNVGNISLPLTSRDASAIMEISAQAPFGRGSATVIDKSFRNTKELNSDQFQLRNPAWSGQLLDIITQLGKDLEFRESPSVIKTELHKLLLYDVGAMFKAHKDSEKAEGMFGTLVICLPSKHQGGQIQLTHRGETIVCDTAQASEFGLTHMAWYSDVIHEIKPVIEGYRLVLTYNLIRTQNKWPNSASMIDQEKLTLVEILKDWNKRCNLGQQGLNKLAYVLDHKYSETNLRFERLKGRDDLLSRYLRELCAKEGFVLLLANMTLTVEKACDQTSDEADQELAMENVFKADGTKLLRDASITPEEIIQSDCFDRYPDETDTEETGNEGVNSTYFYRDSLVIIMPQEHKLEFQLSNMDTRAVSAWMREHVNELNSNPKDDETRDQLIRICKREADFSRLIPEVIRASIMIQKPEIILQATNGYSSTSGWGEVCVAIAEALLVFPFDELLPSPENADDTVLPLANKLTTREKDQIATILSKVENLSQDDVPHLVNIVNRYGKEIAIEKVLPLLQKYCKQIMIVAPFLANVFEIGEDEVLLDVAKCMFSSLVDSVVAGLSLPAHHPKQSAPEPCWEYGGKLTEQQKRLPKHIAVFYHSCITMGHYDHATYVLKWLDSEAKAARVLVFPSVLIPFLEALQDISQHHDMEMSAALQGCCQNLLVTFFNRCVGMEPVKLSTWARPRMDCDKPSCKFCPNLNEFLEDATRTTTRLYDGSGHVEERLSTTEHEAKQVKVYPPGIRGYQEWLDVKKVDLPRKLWKERADRANFYLQKLQSCQALLGDKYEELMDMRMLKLPTADVTVARGTT